MICVPCRERHHEDCPGGTWCDCQHLPVGVTPYARAAQRAARDRPVPLSSGAWTAGVYACDARGMSAVDPLLVARRHVDLLRVRSAICLPDR
jgi:hypothetical protein